MDRINKSKNLNKYDIFVSEAFDKMFKSVGFKKFDEKFVKADDWFQQRTWTKKQSNLFKKWFIKKAVKDLSFSKSRAESEYAFFDLKWGWKEDENKRTN